MVALSDYDKIAYLRNLVGIIIVTDTLSSYIHIHLEHF